MSVKSVDITRDFNKEIKKKINELRKLLIEHDFVYGGLFVVKVDDDERKQTSYVIMADGMPESMRLDVLRDMRDSVNDALFLLEKGTIQ